MLLKREKNKERINQNLLSEHGKSRQHVKQQLCDKPRHRLNDKRRIETVKTNSSNRLKHLCHFKLSIDDSYSSDSSSPISFSHHKVQVTNSTLMHHCTSREDLGIFSSEDDDLALIDTKEVLEENIGKEIERIIIDIYNDHITSSDMTSNSQTLRTEKHFELFSQSLRELPNLIILQILTDKIKGVVRKYKEMMFEAPDIRLIKEKYDEMKNKLDETPNKKVQRTKPVNKEKNLLFLPPLPSLKKKSDKSSCESEHHAVNALLFYLKQIKEALIDSSPEIERIFKYSLGFTNKSDEKRFSIEEMHKEEMKRVILHDDLIALLLIQIKSLIKEHKQSNIRDLIDYIEESLNESKGMSQICDFLIKRIREIQEQEIAKQKPQYFINSNENLFFSNINTKGTQSISPSTSATEDNAKLKEDEKKETELDIDELVSYISKSNSKPKKIKKKKNRKKKKANSSATTDLNQNSIAQPIQTKPSDDDEIESFKQSIRQDCYIAYTVNKIRPSLSTEWLLNITLK